jgi:DNA-binding HxlR family transcriptional regulator
MTRRSYHQQCGLAFALEVVGERWTMLIVRELELGPKRFTDLAQRLPAMGRNLLTERLRQLESHGVITSEARRYTLTPLGKDLQPALDALLLWGLRLPDTGAPDRTANPVWAALAMRAAGNPDACRALHARCELRIDDQRLVVEMNDGTVTLIEGPPSATPAAIATCDSDTFLCLGDRKLTVDEAITTGAVQLQGDPDVLRICFQVLHLPSSSSGRAISREAMPRIG